VKLLSKKAFDKASDFISTGGRPLEQAQFEFHFNNGSVEGVLAELGKFQNPDGGFGHAVEPDVRMPESSPFISSVAFQVISELDVPTDHPMVQSGIAYFEQTHNASIGGWDPTGPLVNDYPRAPWWNYSEVDGRLDELKQSNPGAEIAGYLQKYRAASKDEFVDMVTDDALRVFEGLPDDMEVHSMLCFMRLAECSPSGVTDRLLEKLKRCVHSVLGKSAEEWAKYGGRPLWFAGRPDSLLADELRDLIQVQLDYEIDTQTADGSWSPVWAWGQYEDDWEQAKTEWAGYLTLRNLLALRAWGRV
jgi:hypothetical protein